MTVPRTSTQFSKLGKEVKPEEAMPGDLILFTGQNAKRRVVGHMGIVTDNPDDRPFIFGTQTRSTHFGIAGLL